MGSFDEGESGVPGAEAGDTADDLNLERLLEGLPPRFRELERRNRDLEEENRELRARNAELLVTLERTEERIARLEQGLPARRESTWAPPEPAGQCTPDGANVLADVPVPPVGVGDRRISAILGTQPQAQPLEAEEEIAPQETPAVSSLLSAPSAETEPPLWGRPASLRLDRSLLLTLALFGLIAALHAASAVAFLANRDPGTDAALWSLPLDDGFIHLDYAREIGETGILGYNDGIWEAGATSPLWAIILGILYRLFVANGVHVVIVAKAAGLVLAVGTSVVMYYLVRRIAGGRVVPFLAAAAIALEPTYSFHKVSGMEGPLFTFLVGLALLFLLQGAGWRLGICLGLVAWARPEGYLFVGLVLALLAADFARRELGHAGLDEVPWRRLAPEFLPVILLMGLWVLYNYSINHSPFPNTYLVKHDPTLGWLNSENLANVWYDYHAQLPAFANPVATVGSFGLFALGAAHVIRRLGLNGLPVVLFPWTVWLGVSTMMKYGRAPWLFWTRRYADPALPFFILVAVLGIAFAWTLCVALSRHPKLLRSGRGRLYAAIALLALAGMVGFPLQGLPAQWADYPGQYAWNSDNVDEVDSYAGRWVKENLPLKATVATFDAGAVRYFGERYTVDLIGLNSNQAIGRPYFDVVREFKPDYLFLFQGILARSLPNAETVLALRPKRNTILGGAEAVMMKMDWSWKPQDKSLPGAIDTTGLQLLDSMDVGEVKSVAEEKAHDYRDASTAYLLETWSKLGPSFSTADTGRVHTGPLAETFRARALPGKPLALIVRYDGGRGGSAAVYVDDRPAGTWELRPGDYSLAEDKFLIPADLVTRDVVDLRLQWKDGVVDYYYWTYAPVDSR